VQPAGLDVPYLIQLHSARETKRIHSLLVAVSVPTHTDSPIICTEIVNSRINDRARVHDRADRGQHTVDGYEGTGFMLSDPQCL